MNVRSHLGRTLRFTTRFSARALLTGLGLAGCEAGFRGDWPPGEGGAGGAPPTGGAATCEEDCVAPPEGWSPPSLIGAGSFTGVPSCPELAPAEGISLYSGLQAEPLFCSKCECAASPTGCSIPTEWHASAADCAGAAAAIATPWDGPPGWTGDCSAGGIVAGAACAGEPCVQSLTVAAPTVTAGSCSPVAAPPPYAPPYSWARRARVCLPVEQGTCPEEPGRCFPPPGFALCVHHPGDVDCPAPYTAKELFHERAVDERACSACTCGAPAGNECTVLASAFQDGVCGVLAGALLVTSESGDGCVDVPPGLALGGKTAEIVATGDGACAPSGGEPAGAVKPMDPVTVCCRQDLSPR